MTPMQAASQTISANAYISGNSGSRYVKVVSGTPRTIPTMVLFTAMLAQSCTNTKVEKGRQNSQAKLLTIALNSIARGRCELAIVVARWGLKKSHKGNHENLARTRKAGTGVVTVAPFLYISPSPE